MAEKFNAELKCQHEWGWLLAAWLFLGGTGSALYLLFAIAGLARIFALLALGLLALGGLVLLFELGNPVRAWRGFFRARTSWLSRGVVSVFFFMVSAVLFIAPTFSFFAWLPWGEGGVMGTILGWIAGLSAAMIVLYPGFFLSKNISIPFWNTPLLTVILVSYAALGAGAVILMTSAFMAVELVWVETMAGGLIVLNAILIPVYFLVMARAGGAAGESVRLLNRNNVAWLAWGGVAGAGMVLPLAALLWIESMIPMAGAGILIGGYLFRYCLLRVGVYVPAALVAEANLDLSRLNRTNDDLEREYAGMLGGHVAHGAGGGE